MDAAGIDRAVVLAGRMNGISNEEMLAEIRPHRDRLRGVIAHHHPPSTVSKGLGELERGLDDPLTIGVKFYLGYEHFYPDSDHVRRAFEFMHQYEEYHPHTVMFHCGDCYKANRGAKLKYAHPLGIDDIATDFPDRRIIIAHMGAPWQRDTGQVMYKNPNVFTDLSGFVYGQFSDWDKGRFMRTYEELLEHTDNESDHFLFGTDWPISDQQSYMRFIGGRFVMEEFEDNFNKAFTWDR